MTKEFNIDEIRLTIWNKLLKDRRDINVYQHSIQSSHIVSSNSPLVLQMKPGNGEDFLHISVPMGPGHLKYSCELDLPSFLDIEFKFSMTMGEITLRHFSERIKLVIPPGPSSWGVKLLFIKNTPFKPFPDKNFVSLSDRRDNSDVLD